MHMLRRWCDGAHRLLVFRNRHADFVRMQVQPGLAKARAVAIDIIADDRPALSGPMAAHLRGAAGHRFHGEPGEAIAAAEHLPIRHGRLAPGIWLLPPAALGVETPDR